MQGDDGRIPTNVNETGRVNLNENIEGPQMRIRFYSLASSSTFKYPIVKRSYICFHNPRLTLTILFQSYSTHAGTIHLLDQLKVVKSRRGRCH